MRATVLAAVMACGLATGAEAATYTLTNQVYNQVAQDARASLNFSLTIADAAVSRGSFNLTGGGGFIPSGNSPTYSGDPGDFIQFTANEQATPTHLTGKLSISATFDAAGAITTSSYTYGGLDEMSSLTGSSTSFGGTFGSNNYSGRCGSDACTVTGQLAAIGTPNAVPEPISMALLGSGLLGLAGVRRFNGAT